MKKNIISKKIGAVVIAIGMALTSFSSNVNAQGKEIIYSRISGPDRYHTSSKISGWVDAKTLILANGTNYADALSASALVGKENGAIYLTNGKTFDKYLDYYFTTFMNRFDKVIIVGGKSSVSSNIENELKSHIPNTIRIEGENRYETSAKVAEYIGSFEKAFVATGNNYADALSAGAIAARKGYPIVLTEKNNLSDRASDIIEKNNAMTYVLGGENAVSNTVLNSIQNAKRIKGDDRYETNANIIAEFKDLFDTSKALVASGNTFPDALAGSGLAGKYKYPLILTDTTPSATTKELVNNLGVNELVGLGGSATVKPQTMEQLCGIKLNNISSNVQVKDVERYIKAHGNYFQRAELGDAIYLYGSNDPKLAKIKVTILDNEGVDSREYGPSIRNEINISVKRYDEATLKEVKNLLSKIFPNSYNEAFEALGADKNQEIFIEGKRMEILNSNSGTIYFKEPVY